MKLLLILLFTLCTNIFATTELQSNYFLPHSYVNLSDIVQNPKNDAKLFIIDTFRHSKRVKSKELLRLLRTYGYKEYSSRHSYIQFTQRSPINTAKMAFAVKKFFLKNYSDISFSRIEIHPRTFLTSLPKNYKIVLPKKSYLKKSGTLYIKTEDNKKIFFNFNIKATLPVVIAKKQLERGDELSRLNCKKKSIMLDKFHAMPLQVVPYRKYEARHRIKQGAILTKYDILGLELVKRGESVNVTTQDGTISISFQAKADQNGRLGDTIRVINMHGKRINAVVIGRNRAEIR